MGGETDSYFLALWSVYANTVTYIYYSIFCTCSVGAYFMYNCKTVVYIFPGDTRGSMDYMLSLYIYTSVICTKYILLTIYRNSGNFQS